MPTIVINITAAWSVRMSHTSTLLIPLAGTTGICHFVHTRVAPNYLMWYGPGLRTKRGYLGSNPQKKMHRSVDSYRLFAIVKKYIPFITLAAGLLSITISCTL